MTFLSNPVLAPPHVLSLEMAPLELLADMKKMLFDVRSPRGLWDRAGFAEVGFTRRDDDSSFCKKIDAREGHAKPGVDDDPFVQQDIGSRPSRGE